MPARLVPMDFALEKILEEVVYTMAKLNAHPIARQFIDMAQVKFERCKTLILNEIDLRVQRITAQANEEYTDDRLNDLVDQFDARIGLLPNQSQTALRILFFRGKTPSYIKRPILGRQLELMRTWLALLQETTAPEPLRDLSKELTEQVQAADAAALAKEQANQSVRQFRLIGERKQFIDGLNAWRQELHAELDKIASQTPALPRDFASSFFRSGYTPTNALSLDEEIVQVSLQLEEAKSSATELEERLKDLLQEKSRRDSEEEERKRDLLEIEELERKLSALRTRIKK